VLALNPRRPLALETFKTQLYDCDPSDVTTGQIQTPISRLRLLGLPIPPRQYLLDVAPSDVDVVDFNHRAKRFVDRCVHPDRLVDNEIGPLMEEGYDLHQLWQDDPAAAVGNQPRLFALFESHRRRNRRFGEVFVRLLLRAGDHDRAGDTLYEYVDRYGTDEIFQDLELKIRAVSRTALHDTPAAGILLLPGPAREMAALGELRERAAASSHMAFAQVALSAHNLDRIRLADHVSLGQEIRIGGPVEAAGGAAANTAVALARFGHRVAVAGMIAEDRYGALLRQSLDQDQVDCSNLIVVQRSAEGGTGCSLIFSDSYGTRLEAVEPGVNERYAHALRENESARALLAETVRQARLLNLSSFTGDAERRLEEDLLRETSDETLVTFDPGTFYARLGLDRLVAFILRCDVLYVYEARLRQLLANSSAEMGPGEYSFRGTLEALFRWRAMRVDRPLMVVVNREWHYHAEASGEDHDMITIAVGRGSVQDLVSARARRSPDALLVDITGQGQAVAAGIHLGLLSGAPLHECADLAFVLANEANTEIGSRAGLPQRSTIGDAWAKYFPNMDLPEWVLGDARREPMARSDGLGSSTLP
jgi:sugar/nucleoside kinase (ribokinase family)